jgi:hypothetical protein
VVNGLYPSSSLPADPSSAAEAAGVRLTPRELDALKAAADFRRHRRGLQEEQVRRLAQALPLPQLHLPFLFTTEIGPAEIDSLAAVLEDEIGRLPDPASAAPEDAVRS